MGYNPREKLVVVGVRGSIKVLYFMAQPLPYILEAAVQRLNAAAPHELPRAYISIL